MEQHWGFLSPWCKEFKNRGTLWWSSWQHNLWSEEPHVLEVTLPIHREQFIGYEVNNDTFLARVDVIRKALVLLAAVAYVDPVAWKYQVSKHCGVNLGRPESSSFETDISPQYVLEVKLTGKGTPEEVDALKNDIVWFCGTHYFENPSASFITALARIGGGESAQRKRNIKIPIRVNFTHYFYSDMRHYMQMLYGIAEAESVINEQRRQYNLNISEKSGMCRCTFVMEPMFANLKFSDVTPEMSRTLKNLMASNVRFSGISMNLAMTVATSASEREAKIIFGQLFTSMFITGTSKQSTLGTLPIKSGPSQVGTMELQDLSAMRLRELQTCAPPWS